MRPQLHQIFDSAHLGPLHRLALQHNILRWVEGWGEALSALQSLLMRHLLRVLSKTQQK